MRIEIVTGNPDTQILNQQTIEETQRKVDHNFQLDIERYKTYGQIHIEQYRSLRTEILDLIQAMRQIQFYAASGVTIYYAWILTHETIYQSAVMRGLVWGFPLIIPFFGFFRNREHWRTVKRISNYLIKETERESKLQGYPTGWETHHELYPEGSLSIFNTFWIALVLIIVVLGIVANWNDTLDVIKRILS
jgi:hypothetical protein